MKSFIGLLDRATEGAAPGDHAVVYDPTKLITPHMLVSGMSGTGKSYTIARLLSSAAASGASIDVFDVHEELADLPGAVALKYSQATKLGFNPLKLNTDAHSGGPLRQAEFLVEVIKQVSPQLGIQQQTVLMNLCEDTYAEAGIFQDNPATWARRDVTDAHRNRILASNTKGGLREYYPTLEDLRALALTKIEALTIGGDNKCVIGFAKLRSALKKMYRATTRYGHATSPEEIEKLEATIEDQKLRCKEHYGEFIDGQLTGREFTDIMRYRSVDTLSSVMSRLDLLNSHGIFRANPPPFGDARVRVHQIKSLSTEQRILFAKLRIREYFDHAKQLGATRDGEPPRHIIFLDEAHQFLSPEEDDILNVVAREARKFGIALWCASQQPTDFPRSFLTNVGTTILTGIHGSYWRQSATLLGVSEQVLKKVRPKEVVAVKFQSARETNAAFFNVTVPNPSTIEGRRARDYERRQFPAAA